MISPGFIQTLLKNNLPSLNGGNKCHIRAIPNYRKRLRKTCRNTDRIFTGKLSIVPGKNIKSLLNDGEISREETAHRVAWSAVKKVYEKDSRGNWVKKIEVLIFEILPVYLLNSFCECFVLVSICKVSLKIAVVLLNG